MVHQGVRGIRARAIALRRRGVILICVRSAGMLPLSSPGRCVAACCSVLQRVAAYCSVLQRVAACCSVFRFVSRVLRCCIRFRLAVCCSVLHCVAVCCIVLLRSAVYCSVLHSVAACCGVLQCFVCRQLPSRVAPVNTATRCNTLQHTTTHCNTQQRVTLDESRPI